MTTPATATPVVPTPKNGATTPAQQPVTPPTQSAPQTPDEVAAAKAEAKKWQGEYEKKNRENIAERRKSDERAKTMGEKLKLADAYEKLRRTAGVNKVAAAKELFGDKWYEELTAAQVNGGAPTAESVALEFEQREQAFEKKLAEREEEAKRVREESAQKEHETLRGQLATEATEFCKVLGADYPIFKTLGNEAEVGKILASRVESSPSFARYRGALQYADGQTRAAIMKAAADGLETQLTAIAEFAAEQPKYQPRLTSKLTPAKPTGIVPPVVKSVAVSSAAVPSQQPRRNLSNDLTGSTPGDAPKLRTEEERIKAARAAGLALLNQQG